MSLIDLAKKRAFREQHASGHGAILPVWVEHSALVRLIDIAVAERPGKPIEEAVAELCGITLEEMALNYFRGKDKDPGRNA